VHRKNGRARPNGGILVPTLNHIFNRPPPTKLFGSTISTVKLHPRRSEARSPKVKFRPPSPVFWNFKLEPLARNLKISPGPGVLSIRGLDPPGRGFLFSPADYRPPSFPAACRRGMTLRRDGGRPFPFGASLSPFFGPRFVIPRQCNQRPFHALSTTLREPAF